MSDPRFTASLIVASRMEAIRSAESFVIDAARHLSVAAAGDPLFGVAVHEALTNAVRHGNRNLSDASIGCEVELVDRWFRVRIFDAGPGFEISAIRRATIEPDRIELLPENGFGLPIIHAVFPEVRTLTRAGHFGIELAVEVGRRVARALAVS